MTIQKQKTKQIKKHAVCFVLHVAEVVHLSVIYYLGKKEDSLIRIELCTDLWVEQLLL